MKKTIIAMAAACAALAACSKEPISSAIVTPSEEGVGQITFTVAGDEPAETRAVTAYTTAQTYESQVNKVQVFVFGSDGAINFYQNLGTGPDLSTIGTLSALQATAVDLSANSTTASTGFVMAGSSTVSVTNGGTASCAITVSRLVSRVALSTVVNKLPQSYGAITVDRVFLSNVVGNQNLAGNAAASTWYNKNGRADESTRNTAHIIDGSTYKASCETLTYKGVSQSVANGAAHTPSTPYLFYSFPNSSTAAPSGFQSTFAAQRSVLTVVATISGKTYYYPVVLDNATLERNKSYTVGLTITGLGSEDPNKPVEKGSLSASITVSGWTAGANYDETI